MSLGRCIYNHMSDSEQCRSDMYAPATVLPTAPLEADRIFSPANGRAVEIQTGNGQVGNGQVANCGDLGRDGSLDGNLSIDGQDNGRENSEKDNAACPVKSVHFTQQCPKPWQCSGPGTNKDGFCRKLQELWMEGRRAMFDERGLPHSEACKKEKNNKWTYYPMARGNAGNGNI